MNRHKAGSPGTSWHSAQETDLQQEVDHEHYCYFPSEFICCSLWSGAAPPPVAGTRWLGLENLKSLIWPLWQHWREGGENGKWWDWELSRGLTMQNIEDFWHYLKSKGKSLARHWGVVFIGKQYEQICTSYITLPVYWSEVWRGSQWTQKDQLAWKWSSQMMTVQSMDTFRGYTGNSINRI